MPFGILSSSNYVKPNKIKYEVSENMYSISIVIQNYTDGNRIDVKPKDTSLISTLSTKHIHIKCYYYYILLLLLLLC